MRLYNELRDDRDTLKITVITAVYNRVGTIQQCLESVLGQQDCDVQYIVVDGMSDDGTEQVIDRYRAGEVEIVDVRGQVERKEMRVPGARHVFLPRMMDEADQFADTDRVFVFQCRTGGRSMIAASLARKAGAKHVVNMDGGVVAWAKAGFPIESGELKTAPV